MVRCLARLPLYPKLSYQSNLHRPRFPPVFSRCLYATSGSSHYSTDIHSATCHMSCHTISDPPPRRQSSLLSQPSFVASTPVSDKVASPPDKFFVCHSPSSVSPEEPHAYKTPMSPHFIPMSPTQTQPVNKRPRSSSTHSTTDDNAGEWKEVARKHKTPRRTEQMPPAPQTSNLSSPPNAQAPQPVSAKPSRNPLTS